MTRQTKVCAGWTAISLSLLTLLAALSIWQFGTAQPPDVGDSALAKQESPPPKPTFYDTPDSYDLLAIKANPKAYYSRVIPSRVWQQAPIPPEKERHEEIMIEGEAFRFVKMDAKLEQPLTVRTKPSRPVTFTALDHGHFVNGERSITLPADGNGYAQVDFWIEGGGGFRVLAGSPENHGPAEFVIQALPQNELAELKSGEYARNYWARFNQSEQGRALLKEIKGHSASSRDSARETTSSANP